MLVGCRYWQQRRTNPLFAAWLCISLLHGHINPSSRRPPIYSPLLSCAHEKLKKSRLVSWIILFIDRRRRVATMMRQGGRNLVRRFSRLAAAAETTPAAAAAAAVPRMPAFDHVPLPYDGPSAAEITRKRAEYLSPSLFHFYSKPVRRSIQPRTHLE